MTITEGSDISKCTATASGDLILSMEGVSNKPKVVEIKLKRVFYLPTFNKKIIIVPKLIDDGYDFKFKNQCCYINLPEGGTMIIPASADRLFYIHLIRFQPQHVAALDKDMPEQNSVISKKVDINDYHDKFGHIGETLMRKTLKHLGYQVKGSLKTCDACRIAKARKKNVKS